MAYPWGEVQGAACQAGAVGEAALRSPAVLGDAAPSPAARGALAWEAFLGEITSQGTLAARASVGHGSSGHPQAQSGAKSSHAVTTSGLQRELCYRKAG